MARLLHALRRVLGLTTPSATAGPQARSIDTDFSIFREGDRAVLHQKQPQLTKPLKAGDKTQLRRGYVAHDRIIGSRVWNAVQAHKGRTRSMTSPLPTLEEYVALTPRLVTPIYSHDGNLIVSLLDIHVNPPAAAETQPPLEILESGTGHGSLTLHLARAIHAANTTPPPRPSQSQIQYLEDRNKKPGEEDTNQAAGNQTATSDDTTQQEWDTWRMERNAVIHTVDVSPKFSALAERNVRGFRRGIYAGDVDFYVGPVENWIAEQTKRRTKTGVLSALTGPSLVEPFLSHAILDMPSAHLRIPHVAPILRRDGYLVVFMPSITQIGECVQIIRKQRLPFVQERVVELGLGMTSGRHWDVRLAIKKSGADPSSWAASAAEETAPSADAEEAAFPAEDSVDDVTVPEEPVKDEEPVMVCRPKVGIRTVGGGFVGIWRRIEDPSGR
ncbi:uncharacterized protein N7482_003778 [Penicillium canariense]|uniref:tRNA (adenine(58)-N(1))-methyltransferase catalytic subunit TRM61 n=1 Tax=Penicillium canariense TaxID=189055 RepID=A0A9W9I7N3_9EURO|nr:uncharacterized protein N7482_003778 [Penicillium canariense]KAJ5168184.1 hypothetical protein N7482_003778 [Penicillium canariense]